MGKKSTKTMGGELAAAKKTAAKKRTAKPSASAGRAEAAATKPAAEPEAPTANRESSRTGRDAYEAFRAEAKARAEARGARGEPPSPKKVTRLDPDTLGVLIAALRKRGETLAESAKEAARQGGAMLPYAAEQWTRASECEVLAAEFNRIDDELLAAAGLDYFMYLEMG